MSPRLVALALSLACVVSACESDQERARGRLAEAREAVQRGAHGDAVGSLEEAVRLDATLRDAWSLLARERAELGQHEGAIDAARRVIDLAPDDHDAWTLIGREQLAIGAYADAAATAERALAMTPPRADDAEVLGRARAGLEQWAPAREAFVRALELDATRHPLLVAIGRVEEHLERGLDALATYGRAIEADPASVEARTRAAALLIRRAHGELLGGEDPQVVFQHALGQTGAFGLIAPQPFVDPHAETRAEARALLAAAREHLEGDADPRRDAIDAYVRDLDALDAESERLRAEADERLRGASDLFGGALEPGALGVMMGDSIGDTYGLGLLGLRGVGPDERTGQGSIGLGSLGTTGDGSGTGTGQGYGTGSGRVGTTRRPPPPADPAAAP